MVGHGGDWNSSSTTVTTPRLLSHGEGENFGTRPLQFTPRLSVCILIQQFHSISTLPISHDKNNEWFDMVEIGTWTLKWSPPPIFEFWVGTELAWPILTFCTQIVCVMTDSGNP